MFCLIRGHSTTLHLSVGHSLPVLKQLRAFDIAAASSYRVEPEYLSMQKCRSVSRTLLYEALQELVDHKITTGLINWYEFCNTQQKAYQTRIASMTIGRNC